VSTGPATGGSKSLGTTITSPNPGAISIAESASAGPVPFGYSALGVQAVISAPPGTAEKPLLLTFDLIPLTGPFGQTVQIFRNGLLVPSCTGSPAVASPDPCVRSRQVQAGGHLEIEVLTSAASTWSFGAPAATPACPPTCAPPPISTPEVDSLIIFAMGALTAVGSVALKRLKHKR
jgi:hypothetical protein